MHMAVTSADTTATEPRPWGFWATLGFSVLTLIIYSLAQAVVVIPFVFVAMTEHTDMDLAALTSNGLLLALATCVGALPAIAFVVLLAKLRRGITIRQYFCFYSPGVGRYFKWALAVVALVLCSDGLTLTLGRPIVPQVMVDMYATASFKPLFWLAIVVVAPVVEELVFRGFAFKGLERSRIGALGAILATSLGWAALHLQYDLYGIGTVFVGGLLLGVARIKSNSIYVPIMMHALWSLIATIELEFYMSVAPN